MPNNVVECALQSGGRRRAAHGGHDHRITEVANNGYALNTSFREEGQKVNKPPAIGVAFGCATPGYSAPQWGGTVTDDRIVYNHDYRWHQRKVCVVAAHEVGHHVGFTHQAGQDAGFQIMSPTGQGPHTGYPNWGWADCNNISICFVNPSQCGLTALATIAAGQQRRLSHSTYRGPAAPSPRQLMHELRDEFIHEYGRRRAIRLYRLYKEGKIPPPATFLFPDDFPGIEFELRRP
jgi:hypothetical protein